MKKLILPGAAILTVALILSVYLFITGRTRTQVFNSEPGIYCRNSGAKGFYSDKESLLFDFIQKNFMGLRGEFITNTKHEEGKYTLSESVGLLMNYAVLTDRKDLFDLELSYLEKDLLSIGGNIKWRSGSDVTCNASVDDLRIIGALLDAYQKWGSESFLNTALCIQKTILETQVKDGCLNEVYDWKYNTTRYITPLCYLDLYQMKRLKYLDKRWEEVLEKSTDIIANGRINASPFYYKYYDYKDRKYLPDEEYEKTEGICLTYTVITSINLQLSGIYTGDFLSWLKGEMEKGKLYAWYNPYNLKPVSEMESTAVYALASIYARACGEDELSAKLIERMLAYMVNDNSEFHGGFGNKDTCDFYSFDNLTALIALAQK